MIYSLCEYLMAQPVCRDDEKHTRWKKGKCNKIMHKRQQQQQHTQKTMDKGE